MKNAKPTFDKKRPISWSFISSFEYSPEQWYDTYVLGIRATSKEMTFGSAVDKRLQEDPTFLPNVERYPILQHEMRAKLGKLELVGFADGFDREKKRLKDDKTGKAAWTQKRADETGQLTMYALLLWLTEKIKPEDMHFFISWLPTQEGGDFTIAFRDNSVKPYIFETRRTMRQVLEFGERIHRTLKAAEAYCQTR